MYSLEKYETKFAHLFQKRTRVIKDEDPETYAKGLKGAPIVVKSV